METKTHFKMYKDGRRWVVAGITMMAVGLTIWSIPMRIAHAATPSETSVSMVTSTTASTQVPTLSDVQPDSGSSDDLTQATPTIPTEAQSVTAVPEQSGVTVAPSDEQIANSAALPSLAKDGQTQLQSVPVTIGNDRAESTTDNPVTADLLRETTTAQPVAAEAQAPVEAQADDVQNVTATENLADSPSASTTSTELTNVVKATNLFNVPKVGNLQWSFKNPSLSEVVGQNAWQGADYAAGITTTAKGIDPKTGQLYLDEWMPDEIFQYFLYTNNYTDQYASFATFRSQFTKDTLAQMTTFASSEAAQHVGTYQNLSSLTNYTALMSMGSLEGLQYATNLTSIALHPSTDISQEVLGNIAQNGNLWDISALAPLTKLQTVTISTFSISDISALADKPELMRVDLMYNQISDISPLATDAKLSPKSTYLRFQHLLLTPITLRTGTTTYTTPSFIVKNLQGNNVPVLAFDPKSDEYPSLFPSTADGGNLDDVTLSWSNILPDTTTNYGSFTTTWSDMSANFEGWIIQPYTLKDGIGNVTVNYQLLQADGQQLSVYPTSVLAGDVDAAFDLNTDATIAQALRVIMGDKGLDFSGVILTGSGQNSDYLANNGLAERVGLTGTYTADGQTLTILFLKSWQVQVNYGVLSPDDRSAFAIMNDDGQPLQQTINGNLSTPIALRGDNGIVANLPGYIFAGVEVSSLGSEWTPLPADADQVPFIDGNQSVLVLYRVAQTATVNYVDETTGQLLKTVAATDDPTLSGIAGATSLYRSQEQIAAYEQQGYQLISDATQDADGQSLIVFGDTGQPVTYQIKLAHTYQAGPVQTVTRTINYVNKSGQVIADPQTQSVTFMTVIDQTTSSASGTSYYYLGATQQAPTLTATGQPSDTNWIQGDSGLLTDVANPIIPTYEVVETTAPDQNLTQMTAKSVTIQDGDSVETVTYNFIQGQIGEIPATTSLTIIPVDSTGQALQDPSVQSGSQNTDFVVTAPEIAGYRLVDPRQALVTGTYHGNVMTLTFTYEPKPIEEVASNVTLTINYVDRLGNSIAPAATQSGTQGEPFSIAVPTIAGYRPVDPQQSEVTGTYHGNVMTLTLMYEPEPIEEVASTTTLTIDYVDRLGNSIAPTTTQSGNQGEPFSITIPIIAGYRPVDSQQSAVTGTYHGNVMTLTLTYEPQPTETVPTIVQVTVIYVDQNGRSIATPTHESGAQGTAFTITAPVITDYQLVDPNQQTVTGTYQGNQMTLTLTYRPEQTTPAGTPPTEADNSIVNETETNSPMIEVPVTPTPTDSGSSKSSSLEPTVASAPEKTIKNTPMVGGTATQPTSGKQQSVDQQRTLPAQSGTVSATNQPMTLPSDVNSVIETKLPQTSERATTKVTLIGVSLLAMLASLGWQLKLRRKHER